MMTHAMMLFWPSAAIIALGLLVLILGWLSDVCSGGRERRALEKWRVAMRAPVPQAEPEFVAPVVRPPLPTAVPPPLSVPIPRPPMRLARASRPTPPPLPSRVPTVPSDDDEHSKITGKYNLDTLVKLTEQSGRRYGS
jgi:hypothetical protein